jgi:hypothetical protein
VQIFKVSIPDGCKGNGFGELLDASLFGILG